MQKAVKNVVAKVLFTAMLGVAVGGHALGQSMADVDAVVQKAIDAKAIPGAGVAVVRGSRVLFTKGYGLRDVDAGLSVTVNTGFQIASVTKQFTAAGIMLLVEKGKVKLDDPVGKYVSNVPAKWSGITIRQLLHQVSGIPNYNAGGRFEGNRVYSNAEILDVMSEVPMSFEPGTKWEYSNTNYLLLGLVIEKASGKSFAQYMREKVFKPLGMDSTVVNAKGVAIKYAAHGYSPAQGGWQRTEIGDPGFPFSAGAIVSTPVDMGKWAAAVNEGKLLKKASWEQVFASGKTTDGRPTNYGFGWYNGSIGDRSFVAHSGGIQGFGAYHIRFPEDDLSIVVMTNTVRASTEIGNDIAGVYLPKVAAALAAEAKARNAAMNAAAIEDADPETTTFLRGVFEAMLRGEGDQTLFSEEFGKMMFPERIKTLKGPLGSQGGLKEFDLLEAENPNGTKRRLYRATLGSGMKVRVSFVLDAEGKISSANVRRE